MDESVWSAPRRCLWIFAILWVDEHGVFGNGGTVVVGGGGVLERAVARSTVHYRGTGPVLGGDGNVVFPLCPSQQCGHRTPRTIYIGTHHHVRSSHGVPHVGRRRLHRIWRRQTHFGPFAQKSHLDLGTLVFALCLHVRGTHPLQSGFWRHIHSLSLCVCTWCYMVSVCYISYDVSLCARSWLAVGIDAIMVRN